MKVLVVADTVTPELLEPAGRGGGLSDIDLIISCGDLPPEYLEKLKFHYDVPLLYVLGNHDLRYTSSLPRGCSLIDRRIVKHRSLRIVGFSGSRWYNGGINQYREREMGRYLFRMKFDLWRSGGVDIVVTHAPPRHIHDEEDRCHKGFKGYRQFITKYRPCYFLHGHIHKLFEKDDERITLFEETRVVNCYGFYVFEIASETTA